MSKRILMAAVSVGSAGWMKRKLLGRPSQSMLSHASTGIDAAWPGTLTPPLPHIIVLHWGIQTPGLFEKSRRIILFSEFQVFTSGAQKP
jgi:hypothetical protein